MEDPERWKDVFQSRECRELFKDKVDAVQCATKLKLLNVITRSGLEVVQSCLTSTVACVKLLDILVVREDSWRELLNYLKENNQSNVVTDLENLYQNERLAKDNRVKYYQRPEGLPIPKHWNVPLRNLYFTGRDELLEQLASSLKPSEGNITVISACQGMGGVGKTQLAIEYAHRHKNDYSYIFWFMANQIELEYSQIAHLLNIDAQQPLDVIVEEVKAWLDRHPGGLLVYDNASNPKALKGYLPTMETSSILVTSRTTQWDDLGNSFTVNVFTADEARAYLQGLLGNLFELDAVDTLAEILGYLPLALAQAGAYMKRHRMSPSRYLAMYEKDKRRLLASKFLPPDCPEPVFVTWDITMQAIQKESQLAPTVLTLCACLSSTDIPYFLLDEWAKQESNNPDQEIFEEALGTLGDYSMLTINPGSESMSIHCLVQEVIQLKWTTEEREAILLNVIELAINCYPPNAITQIDFGIIRRLLPHMEILLHYFDHRPPSARTDLYEKFVNSLTEGYHIFRISKKQRELLEGVLTIMEQHYGPNDPIVASTLANLGNAYGSLGDYANKRKLLEQALPIMEKHYGPDHPQVASTLASLGTAYGSLGDYAKQRELLERALAVEEKHYGPDHPNVAIILASLGNAYGSLGDYAKQRELQEQALSIMEKHYDPNHPMVANNLGNLGAAYGSLGEYAKQRQLLERALAVEEKHYGPDHPVVAKTITNLGNAYGSLGDYAKQRELLERALAVEEKHYGPAHIKVAITIGNLGNAYGSLGDYAKQRELLERALPIKEKHYGPNHPDVALTLMNLASSHGSLGDYVNKRKLLEQALPIMEKHYGPDHSQVARTLTNLGNAYGSLGDYAKQRELLERALPMKEKHYGLNHPDVAITITNLGNAYGYLGDYAKQRELLERALPITEEHFGPNHPEGAKILINLGSAYGSLGVYARQCELLEQALPILEEHYGPNHPVVAQTLGGLGSAYGSLGGYAKQLKLLERALIIKEKHYGSDHPEVAGTLDSLGNAYASLGEYAKQRDLMERALPIKEKHYGSDHPEVARTLGNLGNANRPLGEYAKTIELLERALPIFEKHYGPGHIEVAKTLNNLGIAYGSLGEYPKQRDLQESALALKEKHYGPDHPEVARILDNLGNVYGNLGEYVKKRELLERALPIFEKKYGPDHPEVAITIANLGDAFGTLKEYSKQCELLERALLIFEKHYGPEHPHVIITKRKPSNAYECLDEHTNQKARQQCMLPIIERYHDPSFSQESISLASFGNSYGSKKQKIAAGDMGAVEKMLELIRQRLTDGTCDEVMEVCWSYLWNVTDDTPINCEKFLHNKGMELFHECYRRFSDNSKLLRNMMGLMGNIAEVKRLRPELLSSRNNDVFCKLLKHLSGGIEISYISAGVLAHICSDGVQAGAIDKPTRQHVIDAMNAVIRQWDLSTKMAISYTSLGPIFQLVPLKDCSAAQHWALWTLANLTSVHGSKYCPLVVKEGGVQLLENLSFEGNPLATELMELVTLILSNVQKWRNMPNEDSSR